MAPKDENQSTDTKKTSGFRFENCYGRAACPRCGKPSTVGGRLLAFRRSCDQHPIFTSRRGRGGNTDIWNKTHKQSSRRRIEFYIFFEAKRHVARRPNWWKHA